MRIILLCCGRNGVHYLAQWWKSIRYQPFDHAIIVDDASTDGSQEALRGLIDKDPRCTIIFHESRFGQTFNKTVLLPHWFEFDDEDIVVTVDCDDELMPGAVKKIAEYYELTGCWVGYGDFTPNSINKPIQWGVPIRKHEWCMSAPRTYKWFLFKNILDKDLRYDTGLRFGTAEDRVIMTPLLEMAGPEHTHFCRETLYRVNWHNPESEYRHSRFVSEYPQVLNTLASREAYPRKTKEELLSHECDWRTEECVK